VLVVREKERVAVGRRAGDDLTGEDAGGAGAVVDDDLLLEALAELLADEARREQRA
jgi:hypothetical protein